MNYLTNRDPDDETPEAELEPVWSSVNEFQEQREKVINELWEDWADAKA